MISGSRIRIHGAAGTSFTENRRIDTSDLRCAEFSAPCQPSCIGLIRDRLLSSLSEFDVARGTKSVQTSMALEEALANAFYHGSLGLDSQLKADGSNRFSQLARERCGQLPWMDRRVTIKELATPFGVWITIRDQGCGFDVSAAWTRAEGTLNTLASGRGLVMMRAFTDDLIYNETGNEVTLVVYNSRNQDVADLLKNRAAARHKKSEQSSDL